MYLVSIVEWREGEVENRIYREKNEEEAILRLKTEKSKAIETLGIEEPGVKTICELDELKENEDITKEEYEKVKNLIEEWDDKVQVWDDYEFSIGSEADGYACCATVIDLKYDNGLISLQTLSLE